MQEISRMSFLIGLIEKAVVDMAISEPAWGQLRVSNELKKQGIIVSPSGVMAKARAK